MTNNTELEKLYTLLDKAKSRKQAAQNNIDVANKQIATLECNISQYQGELSMAEYFLDYVNQYIADLEKMENILEDNKEKLDQENGD